MSTNLCIGKIVIFGIEGAEVAYRYFTHHDRYEIVGLRQRQLQTTPIHELPVVE